MSGALSRDNTSKTQCKRGHLYALLSELELDGCMVAERRCRLGWTRSTLGAVSGVCARSLGPHEAGRHALSADERERVERVLRDAERERGLGLVGLAYVPALCAEPGAVERVIASAMHVLFVGERDEGRAVR